MVADTHTRTRDEDLQLWVELDAVSIFLGCLLGESFAEEFPQTETDTIQVGDFRKGTLREVNDGLWRSEDDYEEFPEWKRASARSSVLAARLFAFLTTDEAREACQNHLERQLEAADRLLREAEQDAG